MASDAQRRAKKRYDEMKTKQYIFRLRLDADADIIARLESVPCKTAYLRRIVREDLRESNDANADKDACGKP